MKTQPWHEGAVITVTNETPNAKKGLTSSLPETYTVNFAIQFQEFEISPDYLGLGNAEFLPCGVSVSSDHPSLAHDVTVDWDISIYRGLIQMTLDRHLKEVSK